MKAEPSKKEKEPNQPGRCGLTQKNISGPQIFPFFFFERFLPHSRVAPLFILIGCIIFLDVRRIL